MKLIADTHLHIYPFYDIARALDTAITQLGTADASATRVGCLTERYDCDVYRILAEQPPKEVSDRFDIESRGTSLLITDRNSEQSMVLLPGQQIITSENLEILMLNCAHRVEEGLSGKETIHAVLEQGGIPVIAWGFGKWLGARGAIVSDLIQQFGADRVALGDTTMRPLGWLTPLTYRAARRKNMRILFGSDPLPFQGEEIRPGSYATCIEHSAGDVSPETAISNILSEDVKISAVGNRNTPLEVARRMHKHRQTSKIQRA